MGIGPGSTYYPENRFKPERSVLSISGHHWHVWCSSGALEVVQGGEFREWLAAHPGDYYTINFANNASARIQPGHPLWEALKEVSQSYRVEVFPLSFHEQYVPWTGEAEDLERFDCIRISEKPAD